MTLAVLKQKDILYREAVAHKVPGKAGGAGCSWISRKDVLAHQRSSKKAKKEETPVPTPTYSRMYPVVTIQA